MNKYRWIGDPEGYNEFVCLNCHNQFLHYDRPTDWKCCPFCLIEWDGEFTKRNRRFRIAENGRNYTTNKSGEFTYCDRPRLILEYRTLTDKRLDSESFCSVQTETHFTRWHLAMHCEIGLDIDGQSSSSFMIYKFKEYSSKFDEVRLVLMEGTNRQVIKYKAKDGQSEIRQTN